LPIPLIAQEVGIVPAIQSGFQEQSQNLEVSHLLEAAIAGENASANDAKPVP
jgi:hypothetical protein